MLLPPLRERREDIRPLTEYFLAKFSKQQGKSINHIPDEVITILANYDWPGDIRELQNVVERGVILTSGSTLSSKIIESLRTTRRAPTASAGIQTLADAERAHIAGVLRETNGVVAGPNGAAARLGMRRTTLMSRIQRLGVGIERGVVGTLPPQPGTVRAAAAVG